MSPSSAGGAAGPDRPAAPLRFRAHLLRLVFAVTLPLLLLAVGLVAWAAAGQRAELLRGIEITAHTLQRAVDRELDLTIATLRALATSPALDGALAAGPGGAGAAAFHAQALAAIAQRQAALSIIWLLPADAPQPVVNTLVPPGTAPPPLSAARFPPRPIGEPPAPGIAYREALATGRPYVGDLVQAVVAPWIMIVTLPVEREGRVVGVLGAGLKPASLGAVLRGELPPGRGVAALVDRGGIIVARTAEEARFVGTAATADVLAFQRDPVARGLSGSGPTLDGRQVYFAFDRLEAAPFAIAYGAPAAVVDAPLRRAVLLAALFGLLALALASLAALLLGRRLGAEVAGLEEDARQVGQGLPPSARPPARVKEVAAARAALSGAIASLAESETRFGRAVAAARIGTWEWDVRADRLTGSPGREALYGRRPGELPDRAALIAAVHPEDRAMVAAAAADALAGRRDGIYEAEFRTLWPDGGIRWLRTQGRAEFDGRGTPIRLSGAVVDVTERRLAETALRESERRFRLAQDAAGIGVWERDLVTGAATWSAQEFRLHGMPPAGAPPDAARLRDMLVEEDRRAGLLTERLAAQELATDEPAASMTTEYRIRRADTGELRWLQVVGRALPGPNGRPARVVGVSLDVTEAREAARRQELLMREVDHRAKNALAVALSVVQLAPRDVPPAAFVAAVSGRIAAMARAHSLLAAARWSGAELRQLAEGELATHAGHVRLDGPPLWLAADAAQPVAMLLHELATNAAKHGALSLPGGVVTLSWRLPQEGALRISWREAGGPELAGPPARGGFGSRLLHSLARQQLGGGIQLDWSDPAGLVVTLDLPARHVDRHAPPEARAVAE